MPRLQLAAGELDREEVLWGPAAGQLAPLRPRAWAQGVPSWRPPEAAKPQAAGVRPAAKMACEARPGLAPVGLLRR